MKWEAAGGFGANMWHLDTVWREMKGNRDVKARRPNRRLLQKFMVAKTRVIATTTVKSWKYFQSRADKIYWQTWCRIWKTEVKETPRFLTWETPWMELPKAQEITREKAVDLWLSNVQKWGSWARTATQRHAWRTMVTQDSACCKVRTERAVVQDTCTNKMTFKVTSKMNKDSSDRQSKKQASAKWRYNTYKNHLNQCLAILNAQYISTIIYLNTANSSIWYSEYLRIDCELFPKTFSIDIRGMFNSATIAYIKGFIFLWK